MTQLVNITSLDQSAAQGQKVFVNRGFRCPASVAAQLTTNLTGANNDLTYTAKAAGTAGNAVTVTYVVAGNSTPLTVGVVGNAITVNVATSAGGAATSTASQVATAVQASGPASALVSVGVAPGNDGSGVVTAMGATALAGGAASTEAQIVPGKVFQVDVDNDQVRRRLARNRTRWISLPNGSLKVAVRSLLIESASDESQSFVSRGFRVPLTGPGTTGTQTSVDVTASGAQVVDLTVPSVRKALRQHAGRWVEAGASSALVTVRGLATSSAASGGGLSSRGFRIANFRNTGGAGSNTIATVTPTTNVQVDLSNSNVRRTLRRNVGRYIVVSAP